jgi:hypothetical protein
VARELTIDRSRDVVDFCSMYHGGRRTLLAYGNRLRREFSGGARRNRGRSHYFEEIQ